MAIMWFLLGALSSGAAWFVVSWAGKQRVKPTILVWVGTILTIFAGLFTIAWSWSSLAEGETQSASMGLLVFGGITLLLFIITKALIRRNDSKGSGNIIKGVSS